MPRLHHDRYDATFKRFDVYDAMFCTRLEELADLPTSFHLFGNTNIGNPLLTTMQVAGQIHGDLDLVVRGMYLRTTLSIGHQHSNDYDDREASRLFDIFADMTHVRLSIDGKTAASVPLSHLTHERSVNAPLPKRTAIGVDINMFGPAKEALIDAARLAFKSVGPNQLRAGWPALWLHLVVETPENSSR